MKSSDPAPLALCPGAAPLDGAAAGTPAVSWDDRFTPGRFAALLALLIFAAYPDVLLGTNTFFYRDYGLFTYPLAHFHRDAFWHGELPFWNPLNNCGLPFLAQWNSMTLYPLSLIYLLLPMPWALGWFCLGHLFLGGLGMYVLAQDWTANRFAAAVAGLGFALNGLSLHLLMWSNNIAALGWMPFVIWAAGRGVREGGRRLVLAALVGAMQMLAGGPEIILFTWLLAAALCVHGRAGSASAAEPPSTRRGVSWRTRAGRFALLVGLVATLAAAQLLPFFDLVLHSQRNPDYGTDLWAMPAWGWANLLVPLFHCTPSVVGVYSQDAQQWTSSYYAGIGITALAVLGALRRPDRRSRVLGVAALLGLILALGSAGGLYAIARKILPLLGVVRFPIKFVYVPIFAAPLLAAFAVARWQAEPDSARSLTRRWWLWIGGTLAACVFGILVASRVHPVTGERWELTLQNGGSRAAVLAAVLLLVPVLVAARGLRGGALRLGLLLLLGLDVLTHTPRQNPTVPVDAYAPGAIRRTWDAAGGGRVMVSPRAQAFFDYAATADPADFCLGQRRALLANWNLLEHIPSAGGFYSLYTAPQYELRTLWSSRTRVPPALADALGVRWISAEADPFGWEERTTALPLVSAGQRPVFANRAETLRAFATSGFQPANQVLLPPAAGGCIQATNAALARVVSSSGRAGLLEADVEADAPALVTIAQTDYPGWTATVNGRPARIWTANHAFQAVEVAAGSSHVRLEYRERTFLWGAGLSLVALAVCAGMWQRRQARIEDGPEATPA